jgi:hypothetical protein
MQNQDHPFLRPLWRRIVLVVICLGWAGLEYYGGSPTWAMIALAFAGYGAWQYLYLYKPSQEGPSQEGETPADTKPRD